MSDPDGDRRKYIVGWLTCRPGTRNQLLAVFAPYARGCLQEEGCLFFEVSASLHDDNVVTIAECFSSKEAHEDHLHGETFMSFWKRLPEYCSAGRFENIFPNHVAFDSVTFEE